MGATRDARTRPIEVTITPQLAVGCGPTPSSGYTITGDYYKVAAELVDKADVPALPPQYHMAIVYRAMMFYGMGEAATEVYQEGQIEFKRSMALIVLNQLKAFTMGGALA